MATPNPLEPVKGAGTTLWVYNGKGDAYANPLSDDDWQRLAKVKDLTPGEMTAEPTMITTWMMKTRTGPRPGRGRNLQVIPVLRWPGNRERKARKGL
ncbi:putative major tail protein [Escherichia coli O157:H7 str. G5101]|nr:putative major tail protein [Escherichia coli O157:H7 str. G5101]